MKLSFMCILLLVSLISASAQKLKERELTPSRGHYKQLSTLSPLAQPGHQELDNQKFPFDQASAERRLSLKPYYLEQVTLADFKIPDPPANSSEQTRAELNYLLALQNKRTRLDVEGSMIMAGIYYNPRVKPEDSTYTRFRKNLFHIGRSMGSWFNPDNLPLTANLMANIWRDASYFIWAMKLKYLRVRPYKLEKDLNNLEETDWASYPSGHSANSYINAYLYQELAPEFTDVLIKDAYDMAHSREIIGVHYPSDSEASRIFARQFVNKLFKNEKFLKDFQAVKKEWTEKAKETFSRPAVQTTTGSTKPSSCSAKPTECAKVE